MGEGRREGVRVRSENEGGKRGGRDAGEKALERELRREGSQLCESTEVAWVDGKQV